MSDRPVKRAKRNPQTFIPLDIILNILSILPSYSLARFSVVCKKWHSIIHHTEFLSARHKKTPTSLKLISKSISRKQITYCDIDSHGRFLEKQPDSLSLGRLQYYFFSNIVHGLTCAYGSTAKSNIFLLNPISHESRKLPRRPQDIFYHDSLGLGFDPSSGVYKVVRIYSRDKRTFCDILTVNVLKTNYMKWRSIGETPSLRIQHNDSPVFLHGALHWKPYDTENLLCFDIKKEKFGRIEQVPHTLSQSSSYLDLKEADGRLCLSYVNHDKAYLEVWMLKDYERCMWTKLCNIKLRIIMKSIFESPGLAGHFHTA